MSLYRTIHMIPYNFLGKGGDPSAPSPTLAMINDHEYLSACAMLMLIVNIFENKELIQKYLGKKFSFCSCCTKILL